MPQSLDCLIDWLILPETSPNPVVEQFEKSKVPSISVIEEIGGHMPGGFFIYCAEEPEALIYANKAVFDIYGCANQEEFRTLTGFTFRGMVHPEDRNRINASIAQQTEAGDDKLDYYFVNPKSL